MFSKNKIFVICEQSQTHEGNLELAKQLVEAAAAAKADAVKFQVFAADELAVPAYKHYALFKKLEWTKEQWKSLIDLSHGLGLKAMADVFGIASAKMLAGIGIDAIKVHATDIRNRPLLEEFASMDVPLLLSCGGAHVAELKDAVRILRSRGKTDRSLVLMHGFQSYPTLIEHTNLLKMKLFGVELGLPYGFADHIDGDHRQNFSLCAMAIGMGACVIEKHITIDRARKMEDYESALDPTAFADFVDKVRELDAAKGMSKDELLPVEFDYRKATRKHVVAVKPITKGQRITGSDVALKRAVSDAEPVDLENVLGKKALRDIAQHEAVLLSDIV
jgi:sialic acid synthase SpsE